MPGDVLHIETVRGDDGVRPADDLVDARLAHPARIVFGNLAEVDVHAEQVTAFARDVEDVAVLRRDRTLGADVGDVGVREHIHHTPGVIGLVPGHRAPDRRAHLRPGPVAADDVAGPDRAFLTGALAGGVADGDGN